MGITAAPVSAYPGSSDEQPSIDPIHGISALKVYPHALLPTHTVGFYPTFSPLLLPQSLPKKGVKSSGNFLWHYLSLFRARLFTGELLFAVQTFLPIAEAIVRSEVMANVDVLIISLSYHPCKILI